MAESTKNTNSVASLALAVSKALASSDSPLTGIARAGELLRRHTSAEAVQVSALMPDGERVVEIYCKGNLNDLFPSGLRRPLHGSAMTSIASRAPFLFTREELLEASHHGVEDFSIALSAGHNFLVASPIKLHSTNIGAVQLYSPTPLDRTALEALQQVVPLIAPYVSLFLTRAENAVEDRISLSIERVAEAVIQENGIEGVCDAVVRFAKSSMGIDAAVLRIKDPVNSTLDVEYKYGHLDIEEVAGTHFRVIENQLVPMAAERGGPMIIDEGSPELFNDRIALQLLEEVPSLLIMPLMDSKNLLGTMEFYSLNEYAYRAEHLRNVEHVANLLTSAVEHFQLIRSLSREAEIRSLMAEVARLASAADDMATLVASISQELQSIVNVDRVTYFIPAERMLPGSHQSEPERSKSQGPLVLQDGLVHVSAIESSAAVCKGGDQPGSKTTCGASHCVSARLWESAENRPEGWVHLERSSHSFTTEERQLVSEFARHTSPAIDTALSHEAELRLAQEQVRAERAEAEVRNQQQLNEAKQNFIATMSHELRTPLTSIRAFADLLNRDAKSMTDRQQKQVAVVRRNSEWLNILINDLLDLSSIDSGRFELQYEEVEFCALVSGLMESFGPIAEVSGHELTTILPKHPFQMVIDPSRVSQVIGNMLTNATKYSPGGTPIRLLARRANDGVRVYIRDEGPGIPLQQQERIFDRFVRADSDASKKARGTGIGLYVSRMIVDGHGGEIGVTSVPDSHTTMYFWLPEKPVGDTAKPASDAA